MCNRVTQIKTNSKCEIKLLLQVIFSLLCSATCSDKLFPLKYLIIEEFERWRARAQDPVRFGTGSMMTVRSFRATTGAPAAETPTRKFCFVVIRMPTVKMNALMHTNYTSLGFNRRVRPAEVKPASGADVAVNNHKLIAWSIRTARARISSSSSSSSS